MKTCILFFSLFLMTFVSAQNTTTDIKKNNKHSQPINNSKNLKSPEELAQEQLDAYNSRDIEAFLLPYSDDVEVYDFPDKLLFKGKETMRKGYTQLFTNVTNLHCEIKGRMVQGNIVIDKERVQMGDKIIKAIAVYHIENNKIKKVYFINE